MGQQSEPVAEPRDDPARRQDLDPRGRQLDRQRQTVEPSADLRNSRCIAVVEDEVGPARNSACHEQTHRARGCDLDQRLGIIVGQIERRNAPHDLTRNPEREPTRSQDVHARIASQQPCRSCGDLLDQVLTRIEHHERMILPQRHCDSIQRARTGHGRHSEFGRDQQCHIRLGRQGSELDEPGRPRLLQTQRHLDSETRLADAAGSGERRQPRLLDELAHVGSLESAANEAGDGFGDAAFDAPDRRRSEVRQRGWVAGAAGICPEHARRIAVQRRVLVQQPSFQLAKF